MTAAPPIPRVDDRARFGLVWVIPVLVAGALSFASPVLNDGDTFWHVAAGRWMIGHQVVPNTDPFSYTFVGRPWMAHEWLSEVLMGGAFQAAGWSGVMLLTGLAAGALTLVQTRWMLRWLSPISVLAMLAVALACIAPGMLARPHFLALPVAALWTASLLAARERSRAPPLALALVMVLWANLHSSFVVGLGLAGAMSLEALLDFRAWTRDALIGWATFLAAALVAALGTPHGVDGLTFPLKVLNMKALPTISEWLSPDFMKLTTLELALLAGVFVAMWKGVRLTAVRTLIVLGLVHMSLQHIRQEVLVGAIVPLILAEPLGRALGAVGERRVGWRLPLPQTALGAGLLLLVLVGRLALPTLRVDGPTAPITALAKVPAALRTQPVINDYDFGGYLIFQGVRPYIDGRADMYGDPFVAGDDALQRGDGAMLASTVAHYHPAWAILRPDRGLTNVLEASPDWRETYRDKDAVVMTYVPDVTRRSMPAIGEPSPKAKAAS